MNKIGTHLLFEVIDEKNCIQFSKKKKKIGKSSSESSEFYEILSGNITEGNFANLSNLIVVTTGIERKGN